MSSRFTKTIAAVMTASAACACMKCDPYTKQCTLTTGTYSTKTAGHVLYHVKDSGSVFVKSLSYHGPDGWVTVDNPTLPFAVSFPVTQAANIGITAEGTAISGHFSIEYKHMATGDTVSRQEVCKN